MADIDYQRSLNMATFAHDQCLACVHEISLRHPTAFPMVARGPMKSAGSIPDLSPGEWEAIRKLAQLGWAHFSIHCLKEAIKEQEQQGGGE